MRLIDADALDSKLDALAKRYAEQKRFEAAKDYSFIQTVLLSAPTIDAVPVVHGRWERTVDDYYTGLTIFKCSVCREEWVFEDLFDADDLNLHYCHNCGAKMDLEVDGNG